MKFDLMDQYGYNDGIRLYFPDPELDKAMEEMVVKRRQFHLKHKGLG